MLLFIFNYLRKISDATGEKISEAKAFTAKYAKVRKGKTKLSLNILFLTVQIQVMP